MNLLWACKSPEKATSTPGSSFIPPEVTVPAPFGRENFQLEASVVAIDPAISQDNGSVCSKAPCFAYIKVHEVGEGGPLDWKGGICKVRFAYSTSNTQALLADLQQQYPGLKKEDRFKAKAKIENMGLENWQLVIFHYDLLPRP